MSGKKSLKQLRDKALDVIAVLALHGNVGTQDIQSAYRSGSALMGLDDSSPMPDVGDWAETLDSALPDLDRLRPADKEQLVKALIATVMTDNRVAVSEMELLRVVCSVIHVPLPMITGGAPA